MLHHSVEDKGSGCVSSVNNASDGDKRGARKQRAVYERNTDEDDISKAEALSNNISTGGNIRHIKQRSLSPVPREIDISLDNMSTIATTAIPDRRHHYSTSSLDEPNNISHPSRLVHRRASVETPRIRSRRTSIGGTTFYQTSHMAKIDTFLRGSDLRLTTNGTCSFIFEGMKFMIETTAETSEYMFYCNLGLLSKWKKVWAKQLLHMMALWNEEQITKSVASVASRSSSDACKDSEGVDDEVEDDVGLLRIDSSKEHTTVAFILYGHVNNVNDPEVFQDKLDEFVDDALKYNDKLKTGPEVLEEDSKRDYSTSTNTTSLTSSLSSSEQDVFSTTSTAHRKSMKTQTTDSEEAISTSKSTQDDTTSCKKSGGVFAKMMNSIRSKFTDDVGKHAAVDPTQNSAFVIDTCAAAGLKINVSRQRSSRGSTSEMDERHHSRSRISSGSTERSRSAIDDSHRTLPKRDSSLNADDLHRGPSKRSSSFLHDDYSGDIFYPVRKGTSYRAEESRASSNNNPRSSRTHSDKRTSSPDTLNATRLSLSDMDRHSSSRYSHSEPALVQDRNESMHPSKKDHARHHRRSRSSLRPRRAHSSIWPDQSYEVKERETVMNRSRRSKSQILAPPAPPSRPPALGQTSRTSFRNRI